MQLPAQEFLSLCETANKICFFDIEATGLSGDYNSTLTVSVLPWRGKPRIQSVITPGEDKILVEWARDELAKYSCWVSYYGKGFDIPMLQARLLMNRAAPIIKKPHVDMYFHMNAHVKTSRKSQAHRIEWLDVEEKKMTLSPNEWNRVLANPAERLKIMEQRCGRDTLGLRGLYRRTKHLILDVAR